MSNTNSDDIEQVVSVTQRGQATIPKEIRERLGIDTPGRVRFILEEHTDEVRLRPVEDINTFRGIIDSDKSAHELLEESREIDASREARLLDRVDEEGGQ